MGNWYLRFLPALRLTLSNKSQGKQLSIHFQSIKRVDRKIPCRLPQIAKLEHVSSCLLPVGIQSISVVKWESTTSLGKAKAHVVDNVQKRCCGLLHLQHVLSMLHSFPSFALHMWDSQTKIQPATGMRKYERSSTIAGGRHLFKPNYIFLHIPVCT